MIGSSLIIPRQEEQLSPSADEAALPGELSEPARHAPVMFAAGRFGGAETSRGDDIGCSAGSIRSAPLN
jgi:hypothetical protein